MGGRPKPKVITEVIDRKTFTSTQILETSALFVVVYQNKTVNLRKIHTLLNPSEYTTRYRKMAYASRGQAERLAKELNELFNTTDFTVVVFGDDPDAQPTKRGKRRNIQLKIKGQEDPNQ